MSYQDLAQTTRGKKYLADLEKIAAEPGFQSLLAEAIVPAALAADPWLGATAKHVLKHPEDHDARLKFAEAVLQTRHQPKVHKR